MKEQFTMLTSYRLRDEFSQIELIFAKIAIFRSFPLEEKLELPDHNIITIEDNKKLIYRFRSTEGNIFLPLELVRIHWKCCFRNRLVTFVTANHLSWSVSLVTCEWDSSCESMLWTHGEIIIMWVEWINVSFHINDQNEVHETNREKENEEALATSWVDRFPDWSWLLMSGMWCGVEVYLGLEKELSWSIS